MPLTSTSCYHMCIAASKRRRALDTTAKLPPSPCLLVHSYNYYVKVQPLPHSRAFISGGDHVQMTFIWHSLDVESTMNY